MPALAPTANLAVKTVRERVARSQRPRVPEPMVMNDEASVSAFHSVDPLLQRPFYRFNTLAMSALLPEGGTVLDLGSGSGRLLAQLAEARPDIRAVGTDLADNMLAAGRDSLEGTAIGERVELRKADITRLPADVPTDVDLVSTVWALHHLPTEDDMRGCLAEIARIRDASGCAVWIFDFARLRREATFPAIIALAPDAPKRLREDGIASERAAWSARELREALDDAGLGDLKGGPGRPISEQQAYYAHRRDGRPSAHATHWSAPKLEGPSEAFFRRACTRIPSPVPAGGLA